MAARAQHAGAAGLSPSVPAQGWHLLPREASGALGRRTRENQVPRDGGPLGSPGPKAPARAPEPQRLWAGLTRRVGRETSPARGAPQRRRPPRTPPSLIFRRRHRCLITPNKLNGHIASAAPCSAAGSDAPPAPTCPLAFAESSHLHRDNGPAPNPELLAQLSFVPIPAGRRGARPRAHWRGGWARIPTGWDEAPGSPAGWVPSPPKRMPAALGAGEATAPFRKAFCPSASSDQTHKDSPESAAREHSQEQEALVTRRHARQGRHPDSYLEAAAFSWMPEHAGGAGKGPKRGGVAAELTEHRSTERPARDSCGHTQGWLRMPTPLHLEHGASVDGLRLPPRPEVPAARHDRSRTRLPDAQSQAGAEEDASRWQEDSGSPRGNGRHPQGRASGLWRCGHENTPRPHQPWGSG